MDMLRLCMQLAELGVKYAQYRGCEVEESKSLPATQTVALPAQTPQVEALEQKETRGASCLPCVSPDTFVFSNPGIRTISELKIGDRVIDINGKFSAVTQIYSRYYTGDMLSIDIPYQTEKLLITPEHPILAFKISECSKNHLVRCLPGKDTLACRDCPRIFAKPDFISASELTTKHALLIPRLKVINDVNFLEFQAGKGYIVGDDYIKPECKAGMDNDYIYVPVKRINTVKYQGKVMNLATEPSNTYTANGPIVHNCGKHHVTTTSAALGEALRFARSEGMQNPEVVKRVNIAEEELDIMERIDFAPSSIAKLPDKEKPVAHWVVKSSRDIRHDLDEMKTVEDLENVAGKAQDWAAEYKARMQGVPAEMISKVKEALNKVRNGEWTKEEALSRLKESAGSKVA